MVVLRDVEETNGWKGGYGWGGAIRENEENGEEETGGSGDGDDESDDDSDDDGDDDRDDDDSEEGEEDDGSGDCRVGLYSFRGASTRS